MAHVERNAKIIKAIEAKTKRFVKSKQAARQALIDEGIYTKEGELRVEFGGFYDGKDSKIGVVSV